MKFGTVIYKHDAQEYRPTQAEFVAEQTKVPLEHGKLHVPIEVTAQKNIVVYLNEAEGPTEDILIPGYEEPWTAARIAETPQLLIVPGEYQSLVVLRGASQELATDLHLRIFHEAPGVAERALF